MATEAEAQARVKKSLVALESAYQDLLKTGKLITAQLTRGAAKCTEVKEYNLLMMSTYNQQLGWLQAMRNSGMSNIPETPPFPTLFGMMDVSGEDALDIDCSKLPNLVGPSNVKIISDGTQIFGGGMTEFDSFKHGGLGVIWFVVAGVALVAAVGATWVMLDNNATARQLSADKAKRLETRADTLKKNAEARATCNDRCLAKITDPGSQAAIQKCADVCDKIHPKVPDDFFKDGTPKEGLGIVKTIGWIAILAGVAIGGGVLYKRYKRRKQLESGGSTRALVPRGRDEIIEAEVVD